MTILDIDKRNRELGKEIRKNVERAQKLLTETWAERAERIEKEQAEKKEATK